jgi:hypothetical protein
MPIVFLDEICRILSIGSQPPFIYVSSFKIIARRAQNHAQMLFRLS